MTLRKAIWCLLPAVAAVSAAHCEPRDYVKTVAPGVELHQSVRPEVPLVVSALKIDLKQPGTRVDAFVANSTISSKDREIVASAVKRTGAVAGVNGDFFPWTADPLGFTVIDGRLVSEPYPDRPAIAIRPDGKVLIGIVRMALTLHFDNFRILKPNAVDRPFNGGELIVLERYYGATTGAGADTAEMVLSVDWPGLLKSGFADAEIVALNAEGRNTAIPEDGVVVVGKGPRAGELLKAAQGQQGCRIRLALQDQDGRSWLGVRTAVGGEPELVRNGAFSTRTDSHGLNADTPFARSRHPRTAAGMTKNGSLVLLVVDGRQATSRGATLKEIAQIMLDLGCTEALNLDGGGSSTLIARDLVVNSPSDGQQRMVASGLVVLSDTGVGASATELSVVPADVRLVAGAVQQYRVARPDGTPLSETEIASAIWVPAMAVASGTERVFHRAQGGSPSCGPGSTAPPVNRPSVCSRWSAEETLSWDEGAGIDRPSPR